MSMEKFEKLPQKIFYNLPLILGFMLLGMDAIAILAPILAHLGFTEIAHIIYVVYGYLCHQRPWRSIHLFDYQVAWCTRDTFTYLGFGLAAIFVHVFNIRGIKWYVAFLSILPFAIDGSVQLVAEVLGVMRGDDEFFYASTNFIRMITGGIFGIGAGMWLFGVLSETIKEEFGQLTKKVQKYRYFIFSGIILAISFVLYFVMVLVWKATSPTYPPSGLLDHKRYFPGVNYEEVDRGGHGV